MKKINKRGFTLIELLAVIVILGILMLIAIPSVTKFINQSRRKTFVSTTQMLVDAVRNDVVANQRPDCYADIEDITVEKGDNSNLIGYIHATPGADGAYTFTVAIYDSQNKLSLGTKNSAITEANIKESNVGNTAMTKAEINGPIVKKDASGGQTINSCYHMN